MTRTRPDFFHAVFLAGFAGLAWIIAGPPPAQASAAVQQASAVLDDFHDAAAKADFGRYFSHFADDAVFLGTDGSERWTAGQFRAYAKPHFDKGRGWTYVPKDRHVAVSADGNTAWFDERLDNAKYGRCRGSGVLVRAGETWKVAQYNLSVPVPNGLLPRVVELIERWPSAASRVDDIGVNAAAELIAARKGDPGFVILDVRTPDEYNAGHLEGARNLDFTDPFFKIRLSTLDRSKTYLVHCQSGGRSKGATDLMKAMGFSEAYNLTGGFAGWTKAGLPTTR